jgi:hypothetical protein
VDADGIIASTYGGVVCDISTSWAAEWLGKLAAVRLALAIGVPPHHLHLSIADNIATSLSPGGGRPSRSAWLDLIRLSYAAHTGPTPLLEAYTPATHDTGWSHCAASWQAHSDTLAAKGSASARPFTFPFADVLADCALFFRSGSLLLDLTQSMDKIYAEALVPSITMLGTLAHDPSALPAWSQIVSRGALSPGSLRFACWIRASPSMHLSADPVFWCPLCAAPCTGWGNSGMVGMDKRHLPWLPPIGSQHIPPRKHSLSLIPIAPSVRPLLGPPPAVRVSPGGRSCTSCPARFGACAYPTRLAGDVADHSLVCIPSPYVP